MAPRPWNLGPAPADFSALGNLGNSFFGAYDKAQKQQTLADLGKDFASGNYAAAAGKAANLGDLSASATLAGLATKQKQEADWMRENGGALGLGGGQASAPAAAPAAGYFASTRTAESSGDDAARNPNSTATGRYQFLKGTWDGLMRSNPELGLTADGRNDPQQQERAVRAFTAQNANALKAKGIDPNDRNLYMAHFLGAGAAPNFISAAQQDPTVPATSLVSPQVANANRAVFFDQSGAPRSAGDVYQRMTARFGGGSTAVAAMGGSAAPVQVAQAPAQLGDTQSDTIAPGASNVQLNASGYFIPPGAGEADQSLASNPTIQRLQRALAGAPDRFKPSIQSRLDLEIKDAERKMAQTEAVKNYRFYRQEEAQAGRQPMSFQAFRESTSKGTTVNVGGGSDKQIFDNMEKGADAAQTAANGLNSIREARRAVESGGFFGAGADLRLGLQKAAAGLGIGDPESLAKIVNTETFRSAIAPQIAATMRATVGSTQISNADRDFAEKASGGSIALDANSIRRLLGIMEKANGAIIERHQKRLDTVYPDQGGKYARERALFGVAAPVAEEPPSAAAAGPAPAQPAPSQRPQAGPQPTATGPNGQRMIFNGQAWVPVT